MCHDRKMYEDEYAVVADCRQAMQKKMQEWYNIIRMHAVWMNPENNYVRWTAEQDLDRRNSYRCKDD